MCECICVYTYVCIHTYIYTHAHTTHTHTNYVCEHTNINISACQLQKFVRCFVALKPSTQGLFPIKKTFLSLSSFQSQKQAVVLKKHTYESSDTSH